MQNQPMKRRMAGVIIKEGKILLIRRVKNGEEYFVIPGGRVKEGESDLEALCREMKEEAGLDIADPIFLFQLENKDQRESYYLIKKFTGTIALGGPEKERMNENNQYHLEWWSALKVMGLKNFRPREAVERLRRLPDTHPDPEYYKALPRKRMGAGVLLFNEQQELLIVKPSYKDAWSIPGGLVDDNESPKQAAAREVKEEIGLDLETCQFLCLDYHSGTEKYDESLQFIFFGGVLSKDEVAKIKLDNDEIVDYKFVKIGEASSLLNRGLGQSLSKCITALESKSGIYLENGQKE